jgi:hypothetical protein
MIELLYNIYNLQDYFNKNSFKMYLVWNNGLYYYGFIDLNNKKIFTLNETRTNLFRAEVNILINPWKYFPYKEKDIILLWYDWKKAYSILKRNYNREITELQVEEFNVDWLELFNMIRY